MGKIYDKDGKKMGISEICTELLNTMTDAQVVMLNDAMAHTSDDQRKEIAHAILDTYRFVDSSSEQGQRVRKLMDNLMIKYQKSTVQPTEIERDAYTGFINKLIDRVQMTEIK